MKRRLNTGQVAKLCVIFGFLLCFSVFISQNEVLYNFHWIYQSWTFFHKVIILNSSSTIIIHPLAPPYPNSYRFLINQPEKCYNRKPFLVLLVTGESHDLISRQTIRETWGNENNYREVDIVRIFLIGRSPVLPNTVQRLLEEESATFSDIVQQDFLDTYGNLTLKTLMGMEWVTKFCPNASYVMKVDNDVFLNVDYLVHKLLRPERPSRQNFITGYLLTGAKPIRDKSSKWYVPEELYPGNTYPTYPTGPGYVLSADMTKKIYEVAQEIVVINIEDAFIGLCLYKLNISPTRPPKNVFHGTVINYNPFTFCNVVLVHHYDKDNLRKIWMDFWAKKTLIC